jgi:alpha-glucosidase
VARWPGAEHEGWPCWTFSNHDTPRVASRWAAGRDPDAVARLAMLLLMCLRGNVFVYQGEELGLPQAEVPFERLVDPEAIANWPQTLGRDGARTPMPWTPDAPYGGFSVTEPWLPMDPQHLTRAVAVQQGDPESMLALTHRLIALRRELAALRLGRLTVLEATGARLVFRRDHEGRSLICAFNLGEAPLDWSPPAPGRLVTGVNGGEDRAGQLPPLAGQIVDLSS